MAAAAFVHFHQVDLPSLSLSSTLISAIFSVTLLSLFRSYANGRKLRCSLAHLSVCIHLCSSRHHTNVATLHWCVEFILPFHAEWNIKEIWDNINNFVKNVTYFSTVWDFVSFTQFAKCWRKAEFMVCNFFFQRLLW